MLFNLLCEVGLYFDDGVMIEVGIGCFGLFVKYGIIYVNFKEVDEVFEIGMNCVVEVFVFKVVGCGG